MSLALPVLHNLLAVPVLLPILSATVLIALPRRWLAAQRLISGLSVFALLAATIALWMGDAGHALLVYPMGDWPAPFGIVWVYDPLAGLMLLLTATVALISLLYAIGSDTESQGAHFRSGENSY